MNVDEAGIQFAVMRKVVAEREKQDSKWGSQRHLTRERWLAILVEEVGEVAEAILEDDSEGLRKELIQVAAVAIAFVEALEAGR